MPASSAHRNPRSDVDARAHLDADPAADVDARAACAYGNAYAGACANC